MHELVTWLIDQMPAGSMFCKVHIRHSKSVQDGPNNTRTITPEGLILCQSVEPTYVYLLSHLEGIFGKPEYLYSGLPRAFVTLWEIFHPQHIQAELRLSNKVSVKKIQGGEFYKGMKASGASIGKIIATVFHDLRLLAGQPYGEQMQAIRSYFMYAEGSHLKISVGHEPEPSLLLLQYDLMKETEIGLDECQAYIFFSNDTGKILKVVKFCPTATIKK